MQQQTKTIAGSILLLVILWGHLSCATPVWAEVDTIVVYTSARNHVAPSEVPSTQLHQKAFIESILKHTGQPYVLRYAPFKRGLDLLEKTRNALMYTVSRTPAREDTYHWIGRVSPAKDNRAYLYRLKTRTDIELTDLNSVRPYRIGVGRGDLFRRFFEDHGFEHLEPANQRRQNLQKLLAGRIDLIATHSFRIPITCKAVGVTTDVLAPAYQLHGLVSYGGFMVTSKNSDPAFRRMMTEAYEAKVVDGSFDEMVKKMEAQVTFFPPH